MPAKKKKGKASKFARMTDEERARYLQHRVELELEAKRRKQQLIAAYCKVKSSHEEVFARLNNAKINEHWRSVLRRIKCQELYEQAQYMKTLFEDTLKAKDATIRNLCERLELVNRDHERFQKAHMTAIEKFIDIGKERFAFFKENYDNAIVDQRSVDMKNILDVEEILKNDNDMMKSFVSLQEENSEKNFLRIRIENTTKLLTMKISFQEEISSMTNKIRMKINDVWEQVGQVVSEYDRNFETKRKQYEYMKDLDSKFQSEFEMYPKIQNQLQSTVELLKNKHDKLITERHSINTDMNEQILFFQDQLNKLRQTFKASQNLDATQLKLLSSISNSSINKLKSIREKGSKIKMVLSLCSELESSTNIQRRFTDEKLQNQFCNKNSFDVMLNFWDRFNDVSAENMLMIEERKKIMDDNTRMQYALKTYLVNVSSVPSIRKS